MSKNEQTNPLVQNIKKISLSLIDDFPNHPYHIIDDKSMAELTESILFPHPNYVRQQELQPVR